MKHRGGLGWVHIGRNSMPMAMVVGKGPSKLLSIISYGVSVLHIHILCYRFPYIPWVPSRAKDYKEVSKTSVLLYSHSSYWSIEHHFRAAEQVLGMQNLALWLVGHHKDSPNFHI
jgi:hypothetical protein